MSGIARIGDVTTGHGAYGPQTILTGNAKVTIDGIPIALVGSSVSTHCIPVNCHDSVIVAGSAKVTVNGIPIARIGDAIACGGSVAVGSSKVTSS